MISFAKVRARCPLLLSAVLLVALPVPAREQRRHAPAAGGHQAGLATRCFFAYVEAPPFDGPGYEKKVEEAILKHQRTQTFHVFQQITQEYGSR